MTRQSPIDFQGEKSFYLRYSTGLWFGCAVVFALIVLWQYDPLQQPVIGDRAHYLYMAQAMVRGENLYQTTTVGYPPLGFMLSAASMQMGQFTGGPSFLPPRLASLLISALTCGFLFALTRRAFRSIWFGIFSVASLLLLDLFLVFSASNLEPKLLAQFFAVLLMWATQKKAWFWVGLFGGLAALCWQPAVIVLLPPSLQLLYRWWTNRTKRRSLLIFFLGVLSGGMPLIIYLFGTGQWFDFLSQAVFFKLQPRTYFDNGPLLRFIIPVYAAFKSTSLMVFLLAVLGVGVAGWRVIRLRATTRRAFLAQTQNGGLFLHTLTWFAYHVATSFSTIEPHGPADFLPFLFLFSIWSAVGFFVLIRRWLPKVVSLNEHQQYRLVQTGSSALVILVVFQALIYTPKFSLNDELSMFSGISTDREFLAINLPELYVVKQQASPWRSMYISPYFMDFINWKQPAGCRGLIDDIDQKAYSAIVIRTTSEQTDCLDAVVDHIREKYDPEPLPVRSDSDDCGSSQVVQQLTADTIRPFAQNDLLSLAGCVIKRLFARANYQRITGQITIYNLTESNQSN